MLCRSILQDVLPTISAASLLLVCIWQASVSSTLASTLAGGSERR